MEDKKYVYYCNLITHILNFMEIIENGSIPSEQTLANLEKSKELAREVMELPKEKRTEALTTAFEGIGFTRIGQHRIVTYQGKGFQVKNNGMPKRLDEIYQPRDYGEIQNFLLTNEAYNKKMRENRQ